MNLIALKEHLSDVKIATLGNLSQYFHRDADLLRNMLNIWLRKGCVRRFTKTPACGEQCAKCSELEYEIYEWVS